MKASETSIEETITIIAELLSKASVISGYPIKDEVASIFIEEIVKDFRTRYPLIHIKEIPTIFDKGSKGDYGEFYGINLLTINKWIRAYIDNGEHSKFVIDMPRPENQLQIEVKTSLTHQEYDALIRAGIVRCFTDYQTTSIVLDYGNPKMDWLLQHKIIVLTQEQKDDYKLQAREELNDEALSKSGSLYRDDKIEGKRLFEALLNAKDEDSIIQSKAKLIALRDWFEYLLESGDDIHEKIK